MIKAVFIDVDDTLLDFRLTMETIMKAGFEKYSLGEYRPEMLDIAISTSVEVWRAYERGEIGYGEILSQRWNRIFAKLGIDFDGETFEKFFRDYIFDSAILVDGAIELLEHLRGKYILCVASNGPNDQQMNRLKIAGMTEYFEHFFVSERLGAAKPSVEFFSRAIEELCTDREERILPGEIMMIGDSLTSDMAGGIANGLVTCFFNKRGVSHTDGLEVDYTVRSLKEILDIL